METDVLKNDRKVLPLYLIKDPFWKNSPKKEWLYLIEDSFLYLITGLFFYLKTDPLYKSQEFCENSNDENLKIRKKILNPGFKIPKSQKIFNVDFAKTPKIDGQKTVKTLRS